MTDNATPLPSIGDHAPGVVETHTAILFFVGDRVYKLKKAIDLGFLDHRDRLARRRACEDEVRLNSRIAPDVYLGVLDISDSTGAQTDHLVAMRRMPEERRLSRCISRCEDVDDPLRAIARAVTTLHEASTPDPRRDADASATAVRKRWTQGFDQLRPMADRIPGADRLERSEQLVLRYLTGRTPLFADRVEGGRIRDGHGDLQAEDIFVLPDGPRILDCIEFGEEYRWGDVLSDVAFLAMDLERLGRRDLADQFLDLHREYSGDRWPISLAHHFVAYRAHIRAKVTILRHVQRDEPVGPEAEALLGLSLGHLEAGQVRLVLVGGLPGTGKSTLAAGLGDRLGAVVLRSDEVRQQLEPHGATYSERAIAATYREMTREAERLLGLGESVVLDATWHDEATRLDARAIASSTSSVLHELHCTLPAREAAARIERRLAIGVDPSEATPRVATAMATNFAPWREAVEVPTEEDADTVATAAIALVLAG